jgi:5-methylcytosine-specific restriction endonuclease McrA
MTYEEQLKDPRWLELREKIINRDWGYCTCCGTSKNLQVHHKRYISGHMAWEYSWADLTTLCKDCHALEHNKVPERGKPRWIRDIMLEMIDGWQKIIRNGKEI